MLPMLYQTTIDEVVLIKLIITLMFNQVQQSNRPLELKYDCNTQQNSKKLHVGVQLYLGDI